MSDALRRRTLGMSDARENALVVSEIRLVVLEIKQCIVIEIDEKITLFQLARSLCF